MTLYVDVWCRSNPWPYEIRWVINWQQVFYEEFEMWSNNVWEYLAIYWWLFVYPDHEVYTDSKTALNWCKKWKCNTKCPTDDRTRRGINSANKFFAANQWALNKIKLWDSNTMWENPADFWRKYIAWDKPAPVIPIVKEKKVIKSWWLEIMAEKNSKATT